MVIKFWLIIDQIILNILLIAEFILFYKFGYANGKGFTISDVKIGFGIISVFAVYYFFKYFLKIFTSTHRNIRLIEYLLDNRIRDERYDEKLEFFAYDEIEKNAEEVFGEESKSQYSSYIRLYYLNSALTKGVVFSLIIFIAYLVFAN